MKEKDYIEELILKNREELNDNEPVSGHFDRFEARLKSTGDRKNLVFNIAWKSVAAAVFAFLAVNQAIIWFASDKTGSDKIVENSKMTLSSVSPEYEEVEFFYSNAINVEMLQWERMVNEGLISEEEQKMMDGELIEFEKNFTKLQTDLSANPSDERVINAMLEYYQTKLSLLNMIVEKLEDVKQNINTNYEKEL